MRRYKRVVVYISEKDHERLKRAVAYDGLTVSMWLRLTAKKFLKGWDASEEDAAVSFLE